MVFIDQYFAEIRRSFDPAIWQLGGVVLLILLAGGFLVPSYSKQINQHGPFVNNHGNTGSSPLTPNPFGDCGTVTDIDGNLYHTVTIGTQCWMVENLKTTKYINGDPIPNVTDNAAWAALSTGGYCWYNNDAAANKDTYGALYNWYSVSDSRNLCPTGWHVPTDEEWTTLTSYLGGETVAGGLLKESGTGHWTSPNTGATNSSGFSGYPAGFRNGAAAGFYSINYLCYWWSSSVFNYFNGLCRFLDYSNSIVGRNGFDNRTGLSVRCLRDEPIAAMVATLNTTVPTSITSTSSVSGGNITADGGASVTSRGVCWSNVATPTITDNISTDGSGSGVFSSTLTGLTAGTTYYVRAYATNSAGTGYGDELSFTTAAITLNCGTVTDIDGNVYPTVTIGNQCWMKDNLKTTKYRNGDPMPNVTDNNVWGSLSTGGYCWYNNDAAAYKVTYGALYNWYSVSDSRNICPLGWHVPTDEEWMVLEKNLGMSQSDIDGAGSRWSGSVGGKLKEAGTTHWANPNTGATNSTGFTALPGGFRALVGQGFNDLGRIGGWWAITVNIAGNAWVRSLGLDGTYIDRWGYGKTSGYSVRCLQGESAAVLLPTLSTSIATGITSTSAISGGTITSDGGASIIARGVCWSTASAPTTTNSKTTDGAGTGTFISSLNELATGTTYFVRAYATNSVGTAYGNEVTFNTTAGGCTFTDSRDNKVYKCVKIGEQTWMAENLAWLPSVSPSSTKSSSDPYYYVYGYEGAIVSEAKTSTNFNTYGVLYNWGASNISCPTGWHLPTDDEWKILEINQGMAQSEVDLIGFRTSGKVGAKLKEVGINHWLSPNSSATNSSGFTALAGGNFGDPTFNSLGLSAFFWLSSSNSINPEFHSCRYLDYSEDGVGRTSGLNWGGMSVRCVQDGTPCVQPGSVSVTGSASFCAGGSMTLTASGGAGGTIYYQGTTSEGTSTADPSTSKVITVAGTYYFRARTDLGCWGAEGYLSVTENPIPTATLYSSDADNAFCSGSSVTFTGGGGTNYDFRVNGASVQFGASNTYTTTSLTNSQVVDVIVTNTEGCSATSTGITNIVNPLPVTSVITGIIAPDCGESGQAYSVILTPGSSYAWTVPLGATITSGATGPENNQITVAFGTTSGDVSVIETTAAGCQGTPVAFTIALAGCGLDANFSGLPLKICQGQTVTFTDLSTGTTGSTNYSWDFGLGASPSTANSPGPHNITYGTSGLKTISLTVTDGTTKTVTKADFVEVDPFVTLAQFSPATSTRCQGAETITYSTTATNSAVITYAMDPVSRAGGNTIDPATGAVTFAAVWSGTTVLTASTSGCGNPAATTHTVTITPRVVPFFAYIGPFRQNSAAPPLPSKSINNITGSWNPNTISTSEVKTTTYTFLPDIGQCAASATITVSVTSGNCPEVDLGKDTVVCSAVPVILSGDDGTGEAYLWSRIENSVAVTIGSSATVFADRTAFYILAVNKNACTIADTVLVTLLDPRLFAIDSISTRDNTCFGGQAGSIEVFLHGNGSSFRYSIDGGENTQDNGLFENLQAGDYRIQVSEDSVCSIDYPVPLTLGPADSIQITYQIRSPRCKTCSDGRLTLEITGGWGGYQITLSGMPVQLVTESLAAGNYTIEVTDAKGCKKSIDITVQEINVPNVITTNGDGLNDLWEIPVLENYPDVIVKVFNIGGKLVYESEKGYPVPWDGRNNGNPLSTGTYYYIINTGNGEKPLTGYLTILR